LKEGSEAFTKELARLRSAAQQAAPEGPRIELPALGETNAGSA